MTSLSPAAQAVRCDFAQIVRELQRRCQFSVSYTSTLPITVETNDASLQAVIDSLCAAALRAAADQVTGCTAWSELRAIAAELEGQ
jgi:hypothetical protein